MMPPFPKEVTELLSTASAQTKKASTGLFTCNICGNDWDRFIEEWATKSYVFIAQTLGPYQKEPQREILPLSDGAHSSGANASFQPDNGQIRISPSVVMAKPGITLEKITHELVHASLADFPEGDPFYEEGFVDYSVWLMAHAPVWGEHQKAMIEAADFNIKCRRDRALKDLSDYDRKRWAGGLFCAAMHGPWVLAKLRMRKMQGDLYW